MNRLELIANVTLSHIKAMLEQEKASILRMCMLGLEQSQVQHITASVLADPITKKSVQISIPQSFSGNAEFPKGIVSDVSITSLRNLRLEEPFRAILFVADYEQLQINEKSVEKVTKIEPDTLRTNYDAWLEQIDLEIGKLDEREREVSKSVLCAVNESNSARTLVEFAEFVVLVIQAITERGARFTKAIDYALPALKLPRGSGDFSGIPVKAQSEVSPWKKIFQSLNSEVRPLLKRQDAKRNDIEDILRENLEGFEEGLAEEENRDSILSVVTSFLEADITIDSWCDAQSRLVDEDWHITSNLFLGVRTRSIQSLQELTQEFFDAEYPKALNEDELGLLKSKFLPKPDDSHTQFFDDHREKIAEHNKLAQRWEKFIFQGNKEYENFLIALFDSTLSMREILERNAFAGQRLRLTIPNSEKNSYWESLNTKMVEYFAYRFRGLPELLERYLDVDFGKLYSIGVSPSKKNTSRSRDATKIKFELSSAVESSTSSKIIFYWKISPDHVSMALCDDVSALLDDDDEGYAYLWSSGIQKAMGSNGAAVGDVELANVNTFIDANGGNGGRLIHTQNVVRGTTADPTQQLYSALDSDELRLKESARKEIEEKLSVFLEHYTTALNDWSSENGKGLQSESYYSQGLAYSELLDALSRNAVNDKAKQVLWTPLLRFGLAYVAREAAAIVTPWHPLRMLSIWVQNRFFVKQIEKLVSLGDEATIRADLMRDQVTTDLTFPFYPDICAFNGREGREFLSNVDSSQDYSLVKSPLSVLQRNLVDDSEVTAGLATKFVEVSQKFLDLLPHERSNFSVLLYAAKSKNIPVEFAKELSKKIEEQSQLQCDVVVTNDDPGDARKIYRELNADLRNKPNSLVTTEATRNFLSRLRVRIFDEGEVPNGEDKPFDLVALCEPVSLHAAKQWLPRPGANDLQPDLMFHVPTRWSRQRPIKETDQGNVVYLTCPVQPEPTQKYLNNVHLYVDESAMNDIDSVPVLSVQFSHPTLAQIVDRTHKLGEWVVNVDPLIDRRLLEGQDIDVIWHSRDKVSENNAIVSTKSDSLILRRLLEKQIDLIDPILLQRNSKDLIEKILGGANRISGHIVLRASKFGVYAKELLGVLLSARVVAREFGPASLPIGSVFLDDYATWFSQKEERIADLLLISPQPASESSDAVLRLAVVEAKFVSVENHVSQRNKSVSQLVETVNQLVRAFNPNVDRVDREIFLHRIADLMIQNISSFEDTEDGSWDLFTWSEKVRNDEVPIEVVGYSCVFVHDQILEDEHFERESEFCYSGTFGKSFIAHELRSISDDENQVQFDADSQHWVKRKMFVSKNLEPVQVPEEPKGKLEDRETEIELDPHSDGTVKISIPLRVDNPARLKGWNAPPMQQWVYSAEERDLDGDSDLWLESTVHNLKRALRNYQMSSKVEDTRLTPNAALIRFQGDDDLTVDMVKKFQQRLLTSHGIEILDVLPEPGQVVVSIKREHRQELHLQNVWAERTVNENDGLNTNSSLTIGMCEATGEVLYLNAGGKFGGYSEHAPHTLIAGQTGSGKGVLIQCMLLDICATNSPTSVRIKLIDPKSGIDYAWIRDMPHLDGDVITKKQKAISTLRNLVTEMEKRNHLIAEARVSNFLKYNKKVSEAERLPRIWVFHDELTDWMLDPDYRDEIETNVNRLGVKARAAGINLVMAAQRPDRDALPMQLRANLNNRLILKVADERNSKLVLDAGGAEKLLGNGHLIAKLSGESDRHIYAQVPFIDNEQLDHLAKIIRDSWKQEAQ